LYGGSFLGVKRPWLKVDHSLPSTAEVKSGGAMQRTRKEVQRLRPVILFLIYLMGWSGKEYIITEATNWPIYQPWLTYDDDDDDCEAITGMDYW
jgi:hypothetical protein